jgi:23S rRNA pseudouridine2457 synthase
MAKIILFNKPFNVLSQFTDKEGRSTLADFIENNNAYPAGRLDYDSEGLLLLTDDGAVQHQISHPSAKSIKTYWAQVEGQVNEADLEPLIRGIRLNDGPCRPAKAKVIDQPELWPRIPPIRVRAKIPTTWLQISISEGRNRQVRRMTAAIGYPTLRLIRASIGNWSLGQLQPGESKQQTIHSPANNSQRQKHSTRPRRRL